MQLRPAETRIVGSASAAFLVSKMMVSSRTSCAISLSIISLGLRPDLRRISSHSGDMFLVWKLPYLSIQTEFDFTTSSTTDSSFCFYGFLKMFLILPKKEVPFYCFSLSSASRFLRSSRVCCVGAQSSSFLAKICASTSFLNCMQMVPRRQRSKPHRLSSLSFSLQLSMKPQQSSTSSSNERFSRWQKRRKQAFRCRSKSRCSRQIWVEQRR